MRRVPSFFSSSQSIIFAFASAISIATGLLFGLAPAWQASRVHISSGLKDSAQTATRRRKGFAGKAIVVVQISLAMLCW